MRVDVVQSGRIQLLAFKCADFAGFKAHDIRLCVLLSEQEVELRRSALAITRLEPGLLMWLARQQRDWRQGRLTQVQRIATAYSMHSRLFELQVVNPKH